MGKLSLFLAAGILFSSCASISSLRRKTAKSEDRKLFDPTYFLNDESNTEALMYKNIDKSFKHEVNKVMAGMQATIDQYREQKDIMKKMTEDVLERQLSFAKYNYKKIDRKIDDMVRYLLGLISEVDLGPTPDEFITTLADPANASQNSLVSKDIDLKQFHID